MDTTTMGVDTTFHFTSLRLPFKARAGWVQDFKNKHKIRQRSMMKYISSKGNANFEERVKNTELFQK
jgi:hypothetical protein